MIRGLGHNLHTDADNHRLIPTRTKLYALQFDGVNDYIGGSPYMDKWDVTQDCTVEFWLKDFGVRTVAQRELIVFTSFSFMEVNLNTRIRWRTTTAANVQKNLDYIFPGGFNHNAWTHFTFRYKASTGVKEIFLNGAVVASENILSFPPSGIGSYCAIGATQTASLFYQGSMDEVRIYQRYLSNAEITYSYNAGAANFPQDETGLQFWFAFENYLENLGSASTLYPMNNFTGFPFVIR